MSTWNEEEERPRYLYPKPEVTAAGVLRQTFSCLSAEADTFR